MSNYDPNNPYNNQNGYVPPQGVPVAQPYPQLNNNYQQPQSYESYTPTDKVVGQPVSSSSSEERFDYAGSPYKDKWFALLFVLHLLAIVACAVVWKDDVLNHVKPKTNTTSGGGSEFAQLSGGDLLVSLGAAAVAGLVFGGFWLWVMKKCSDTIIKISLMLTVVMFGAMAAVSLVKGSVLMALVFALFAAFQVLYFYCVRHRIPFTQAVISASVTSIQDNPGSINVSYVMAVFQVVWICLWVFATAAVSYHMGTGKGEHIQSTNYVVWFLLLVSFYWTGQVLKNVAHVTIAGSVATWWLLPTQSSPTCGAFKRATTTSFGSICFGSLIVAVLEATRAVVRQAREQARRSNNGGAACALCCLECILDSLDRLVQYFNLYAYTHVAIYGKDFIGAAKDTWRLFCDRGFEVLINDDLTGLVLGMGMMIGGVVSSAVGAAVSVVMIDNPTTEVWGSIAAISFLIGLVMTSLMMAVVQSAVATTYVVWAEMPNEISQGRPQHYNKLVEAARILHPSQSF